MSAISYTLRRTINLRWKVKTIYEKKYINGVLQRENVTTEITINMTGIRA